MSESTPTLSTPAGVSAEEFTNLLAKGKQVGSVTPDDIMDVLEDVELSADLIDQVRGRLDAEGINLEDDDTAADEPLEQGIIPPPAPMPAPYCSAWRWRRPRMKPTSPK